MTVPHASTLNVNAHSVHKLTHPGRSPLRHAGIAHQSLMVGPLTVGVPHVCASRRTAERLVVVCLELLGAQSAVAGPRAGAVHCAAEDLVPLLVVTSSVPGLPLSLGPRLVTGYYPVTLSLCKAALSPLIKAAGGRPHGTYALLGIGGRGPPSTRRPRSRRPRLLPSP